MVVTVHDLIPLVCREHLARSRKVRLLPVWKAWVKLQCQRAAAVAADSRHSAADLTRLLGVPAGKVHVIHPPVRELRAAETRDEYRRRRALDGAKVLSFVSRQDPYKNLLGLVRALPEIAKRLGQPVRLVVAGRPIPATPSPAGKSTGSA